MKRLVPIGLLIMFVLAACAPTAQVENNVVPTLLSVTVPDTRSEAVLLQGRYFGDGFDGERGNSYVILAANINGRGGVRVEANSWSPGRITVSIPEDVGYGYVFVVVRGVMSNGIPANLP